MAQHPFTTQNEATTRSRCRGVGFVLAWLEAQPGVTWQERWASTGAESLPKEGWLDLARQWFIRTEGLVLRDSQLSPGLLMLICRDVIRPTSAWLLSRTSQHLARAMASARDSEGFERLGTQAASDKVAAPHALEIADRWHLLQNLSSAVEKTCHQHRGCLRKRLEEEQLPDEVEVPDVPVVLLLPPELPRTSMVERTRHRHADVHRMLERGWTISAIGRHLGLDRKTVRKFKYTDLDVLLSCAQDRRPNGVLEPFKPYLNARFTNGITSGTQLFQEIRDRGYRGSVQVVRKHLAALKTGTAEPVRVAVPSPRKITSWIMRPREKLSESEVEQLDQVRLACPDIARACDLARVFQDLVRNRRGHLLLEWIRQAESDGHGPMRSFAGFLRQDLDAVTAGLTHTWSSGMVEGHVNRVKTLKRAIYGRASFRLLRIRILTRP
ncbi:transposase [Streptomyces sp. NPDC059095]|uniref:transposase n=1 Tax=Streptomyces sp. NPDC059095 TaxID=3346726 RepID=UPI00369E2220